MDTCDVNKRPLAEVMSVVSVLVLEEGPRGGCSRGHGSQRVAPPGPPDTHPQPRAQEHPVRLLSDSGVSPQMLPPRDVLPAKVSTEPPAPPSPTAAAWFLPSTPRI